LQQFRHSHGAINSGTISIVFGGNNLRLTEVWDSKNDQFVGSSGSQHFDYSEYPELFVVPLNFCPEVVDQPEF